MTADPRPAPPEHADRDALLKILDDHMNSSAMISEGEAADAILAAGFARTPERASGTAEPVVWLVRSGADYYSVPLTDEQDAKDTAASWKRDGLERPIVLVPLYLHPAPPPSVGATPAPEKK